MTGQRIVPAGGNEAGLAHRFKLLKKAERSDRNGGETSSVQTKWDSAANVPATTQIPQAVIPKRLDTQQRFPFRSRRQVSAENCSFRWFEDPEMQAAPEQPKCFRFAALCGAIHHAAPQAVCRELPCADVLRARMASDQSDILDRAKPGS